MLKLYYSPGACALASHIALEEAGAKFETQLINLREGQQKTPEFLAVNPAGSTPALVTDEGVITENVAIMNYAAQLHPEAKLAATGSPFAIAKMLQFNGFLSSSLHPAIGRALFARPPLEGDAKTAQIDLALSKYDVVEKNLYKGPWALGDSYSVTDGYLYVFCRWAKNAGLLDAARYPKLNAHIEKMQQRPAVLRALETEGTPPL